MTNWKSIIQNFKNLHAIVIGDVMIDAYVWGNTSRISPEAPVPVVQVSEEDARLGGAANVAKNLVSLGAKTTLIGVTGSDRYAGQIQSLAEKQQIDHRLFQSKDKPTTVKTRIIAQDQHLLRIDEECENYLSEEEQNQFTQLILDTLDEQQPDVVLFEDYDKGALSPKLISAVIAKCKEKGIKTCVDPKKKNFLDYKGVDLFKPNLKECREGLNLTIDPTQSEDLGKAHTLLHDSLGHKHTLVTLSEYGVFGKNELENFVLPAFDRKIIDVSGAGDTVISVAALVLAQDTDLATIAYLSNMAGGLVCEHIGVVSIEPDWLIRECEKAQ